MKIPKTDNSLVLNFIIKLLKKIKIIKIIFKKKPVVIEHQPNTGLKFELPIRDKSMKRE